MKFSEFEKLMDERLDELYLRAGDSSRYLSEKLKIKEKYFEFKTKVMFENNLRPYEAFKLAKIEITIPEYFKQLLNIKT